jgi:competence protein ComEC
VGGMTTSKVTRFRAYQLGASGSWFSYFVDGHFTVLEARMTEISQKMMAIEMNHCEVSSVNALHITSWDSDHCSASELPDLLKLTRPLTLDLPGYSPSSENAKKSLDILRKYVDDRSIDNRTKSYKHITPEYIGGLDRAQSLCFRNTIYNPLVIAPYCANDNSTVQLFRGGSFNVLSLGDVESSNISARLSRCSILGRETDLMILAHHGADNGFTTKKFLRHLEPTLAICSADYANQYDHPRKDINDLLYQENVRLMTTKTGDVVVMSVGDHTGDCRAINLITNSTEVSSEFDFTAKKKRLLSFNDDTLRQMYAPTPPWRRIQR